MTKKRKRTVSATAAPSGRPAKQAKTVSDFNSVGVVKHAVLTLYYPRLHRLREWVLAKLPAELRRQWRKIADGQVSNDMQRALGYLLDMTLVAEACGDDVPDQPHGAASGKTSPEAAARWEQWVESSQKGDELYSKHLFSKQRSIKSGSWPKNFCDGFCWSPGRRGGDDNAVARETAFPSLRVAYYNRRVQIVKEEPWPQLFLLLGKEGRHIIIDLLLDCFIFTAVRAGKDNFY
ncbi:hypothetical protein CHU98_g2326 [Xylaria longipes]|nr:hypothetical protein CHU98_g2326 [Xylaria longipes]